MLWWIIFAVLFIWWLYSWRDVPALDSDWLDMEAKRKRDDRQMAQGFLSAIILIVFIAWRVFIFLKIKLPSIF